MAQLRDLKKRLKGVELTRQLAGAMKTVSSAKFAKLNRMIQGARSYSEETERLLLSLGSAAAPPRVASGAGCRCLLVIGHNRGLCGGYNAALHSFAASRAAEAEAPSILVTGKAAIAALSERFLELEAFSLPDVPSEADWSPLFLLLMDRYLGGVYSEVRILHQHYHNTLTQTPEELTLLPFPVRETDTEPPLCIPDATAAGQALWHLAVRSRFCQILLDSALGAQAATLTAMRTAYDNAGETAKRLEVELQKKRQTAVTSGVLETATGVLREGEGS